MNDPQAVFAEETTHHELSILRDDGLYRHLRCRKPGKLFYGFDITTWPGYLAMTGDIGNFIYSCCHRDHDMLVFFRDRVNPTYWAQKCLSWPDEHRHVIDADSIIEDLRAALHDRDEDEPDEDTISSIRDLDGSQRYEELHQINFPNDYEWWECSHQRISFHERMSHHAIHWAAERYWAAKGAVQ